MKKQIYLTAPINDLSYGLVSQNILNELVKHRDVLLSVIGPQQVITDNISNSVRNFSYLPPHKDISSVKIFHQFDLAHHIGKGKHIGFPIFELDGFNQHEVKNLSMQDTILVASQWAKDVVDSNLSSDCQVVPLGVDREVFKYKEIPNEVCVFLNIGKMEYRKGKDVLIKACSRVFKGKKDCMLWMMADNRFTDISHDVNTFKQELGNQVAFIRKVDSTTEVANIINRATFGLFPYRAEGFCLPLLECLSCGLNVAATNYSAPTEYLNSGNSSLIEIENKEKAFDGIFFGGKDGSWAKLDERYEDRLVDVMEYQYESWKHYGKLTNYEGIETAKEFSWEKTSNGILRNG